MAIRNYFEIAEVSTGIFESNRYSWDFNSVGMLLLLDSSSPSDVVLFSFDGSTVHGIMKGGEWNQGLALDNLSCNAIWLARETAGSAVNVQITAWG